MDVKLVVEKGRKRVRVFTLRSEETIVGRRKGCDLRIPSEEVSRQHCLLSTAEGYLTVEDLDSANGTQLNGEPISGKQVVRPGDKLKIGPVAFVVEYQLTQSAINKLMGHEESAPVELFDDEEAEVAVPLEDDDSPLPVDDFETEAYAPLRNLIEDDSLPKAKEELAEVAVDVDALPAWHLPQNNELHDLLSELSDPMKPIKHHQADEE